MTVEKILGGIGAKAFGSSTNPLLKKALNAVDNTFSNKRVANAFAKGISTVFSANAEGAEEFVQALLEPILKNVIYGENNKINADTFYNAVRSYLIGAITGFTMDVTYTGTGNKLKQTRLEILGEELKSNLGVESVIEFAEAMENNSVLYYEIKGQFTSNRETDNSLLAQLYEETAEKFENPSDEVIKSVVSKNIDELINIANDYTANRHNNPESFLNIKTSVNDTLTDSERQLVNTPDEELTPEQRAVKQSLIERQNSSFNSNNQNSALQTDSDNGIINNNDTSVIGDEASADRGPNEASVGEIRERYFKKTANNDKRNIPETSEAFAERTRRIGVEGSGKKRTLLKTGKSNVAYTPSDKNTPLSRFVKKLNSLGIEAYCCEGTVETNSDGVTTVHDEAMTTSKGKIFFCESSVLTNKEKADHELVHYTLRQLDDSYLDFEEIIMKNLNFESNYYIALCMELNEREYDNQYKVTENGVSMEDASVFNSELTAYVYQMVLNKPNFANEYFSNMFTDWKTIVEAVKVFNSKMKVDTNELLEADPSGPANFMPENDNSVDGERKDGRVFREPSTKEIYRDPTEQENMEAMLGERKDAKQRHILDVAKKLDPDLKVIYVDRNSEKLKGKNGKYVRKTNIMYLANDSSIVEMYYEVFKHEFVHRLESRGTYQSFKKYLFDKSTAFEQYARAQLKIKNGIEFKGSRDEALQELAKHYYNQFMNDKTISKPIKDSFTMEDAEREVVADFVGEVLFKGSENRANVAQALSDGDMLSISKIENSLEDFKKLAETDRNLFQKILDAIKELIRKISGSPQTKRLVEDLEYIEQRLARVYDSRDTKKAASRAGNEKYYINDDFYNQLNKWDRETVGFSFVLGETSKPLKLAGIPDKQIRWDASKIKTLLNKHSGMTIEVIKQIPELLESPVVVIDSKQDTNSRIIMGDLYDEHSQQPNLCIVCFNKTYCYTYRTTDFTHIQRHNNLFRRYKYSTIKYGSYILQ